MPSTFTSRLEGLTTSVAVKAPCRVATTAAITLSGLQTIDGVALSAGDRVLVKNQSSAIDNGIWIASVGAWTRAADFDGTLDAVGGTQAMVISGSTNGNTYWRVDGAGDVNIGQDGVTFEAALISDSATQTFLQSGSGAKARSVQDKLRDRASLWDFEGYDITGASASNAAIEALFACDAGELFIPPGNYVIDDDIVLPAGKVIRCSPGAIFLPGANNLKMFKTTALTMGTEIHGLHVRGDLGATAVYTGVTALDLSNFRHGCRIAMPRLFLVETGILLRELCWNLDIDHPFIGTVDKGIVIDEGSNAVTIFHPSIDGFDTCGIHVKEGNTAASGLYVVDVNIIEGFVQNGPTGLLDEARATKNRDTYYEGCTLADIHANGAIMPHYETTHHSANTGVVCVKGSSAEGVTIRGIDLQGTRSGGLFDFDGTNTYCRAEVPRTATLNTTLGVTTGLKMRGNLSGNLELGDIGYDGAMKLRAGMGASIGTLIQRSICNGFHDMAAAGASAINVRSQTEGFYDIAVAAENYTFTNFVAGQTIMLFLKLTGSYTTGNVSIEGITLDMTGAAAGLRCFVVVAKVGPDGDAYYILQGRWHA